ncbi:NAD(+)/NADH kinase [Candidatus Saccharibacteria bacterium]|nr:NAD(+)/NADH kinase [Candidatus Saccharibacteria bacterium]
MKIILVYNQKSGSSLSLHVLRKKLVKNKIEVTKAIKISPSLKSDLSLYINKKNTIVAIGGDGTISAVAGIVANTKAILAPLPGGTLNHFTKDLGIPQNIDEAIKNLKNAQQHKIDVASVNDTIFINNSSIGLYPASLKIREETEDALGKWLAAALGIFRAIIHYKTYNIKIGRKYFATPFIFIGNNSYKVSDFALTNRTSLKKGKVAVYLTKAQNRFALAKIFVHAAIGRLHKADGFESFLAEKITIETRRQKKIHVSHDGEISKLSTPLIYKILPKSLTILK